MRRKRPCNHITGGSTMFCRPLSPTMNPSHVSEIIPSRSACAHIPSFDASCPRSLSFHIIIFHFLVSLFFLR